jgi:predicted NUDIX family NTP pyrophosphohydrolase
MLVHPGGPFWVNKDEGAWSIPKGLIEEGESLLAAAKREFSEETGFEVDGDFIPLGEMKQASGKTVHAWALEKDIDTARIVSNLFELEWPRHSGRIRTFPEIDRGGWFTLSEAKTKIAKGQRAFIDRLVRKINYTEESPD